MALLPPDPLFCLKSDMGHIHNICFVSDETSTTHLLVATEEGHVYLWDLKTNRVVSKQKLGISIQTIHCIDTYLITQEKSGLVSLWDMQDKVNYLLLKKYQCNGGYCRSIIIKQILILPHINSALNGINCKTLEKAITFTPSQEKLGQVMCLEKVEMHNNLYVLAGYETGDVVLWDFSTSNQCGNVRLKEYITSVTYDSITGRGVCGNSSNILQFFTIDKEHNIKLKCEISLTNDGCNVLKLRPDRKILACGGWDGRLRLFSWKSLRILVVLNQHHKSVTDVQFSPNIVAEWDSNIMAVASGDGSISLWSLYN
ncbi:hypothetical protein FQA39_LY16256 [Lamprigera yunnana]|nr:hypothetical protein FQA39_LY16256 [Lamprigera yunnana]